jgi:hypothetical protein
MFELFEGRHIRPITPMHVFSFEDVPNAIRFIRAGKHIGKIVISSGPDAKVKVPVSLVSRSATFSVMCTNLCERFDGLLKSFTCVMMLPI